MPGGQRLALTRLAARPLRLRVPVQPQGGHGLYTLRKPWPSAHGSIILPRTMEAEPPD